MSMEGLVEGIQTLGVMKAQYGKSLCWVLGTLR